jgi:hypothetical protein
MERGCEVLGFQLRKVSFVHQLNQGRDDELDRRTRAPTPSDWDTAKKLCLIARATDIFSGASREGSLGGITGRPTKVVLAEVAV